MVLIQSTANKKDVGTDKPDTSDRPPILLHETFYYDQIIPKHFLRK